MFAFLELAAMQTDGIRGDERLSLNCCLRGGVFNISRGRAGVSQSSALGSRSDCLKPGG